MSQEPSNIEKVIDVFAKFLDPKLLEKLIYSRKGKISKIQDIDDLLKLPIYSYRFLDKQEAKILEEILDVFDIGEAAQLNKDDPFEKLIELESTGDPIKATQMREQLKEQIQVLKEKFPDLDEKIRKAITVSSLIAEVKNEEIDVTKDEQKVVVAGLDNAGKTAIISKFSGKLGLQDLAMLKPTKGVDRQKIAGTNLDLIILDMGGQEEYRKRYLERPENYFLQLDLLIYVIDVQESERFDEAIGYLKEILDIILQLEENPYILLFLHKFDPDVKNKPEIQLNQEYLNDVTKQLFSEKNINGAEFDYEIYLTSIYSLISNEPEFSKFIKDIMKSGYSLTDPTVKKVEGLGKILEETMNVFIRLSENISVQINNIDERLQAIESGQFQIGQVATQQEVAAQAAERRDGNARSQVLTELKDLFAKKRRLNI